MAYLAVKAFHLLAVVLWVGGMLALPWLYAAHARVGATSPEGAALGTVERSVLRWWVTPGLVLAWALGITLLVMNPALMKSGWLHAKLTLVLLFSGMHGFLAASRRKLEAGTTRTPQAWTAIGAGGLALAAAAVLLAVLKPF